MQLLVRVKEDKTVSAHNLYICGEITKVIYNLSFSKVGVKHNNTRFL